MRHANDLLVPLTMDKEKVELQRYLDALEGKTRYSDLPEMAHNPFVCNIIDDLSAVSVRFNNKTDIIQATPVDTQELITFEHENVFKRRYYVDKAKYAKVYMRNLKDMFMLTGTALKLFGYFISAMDLNKNSDMVYMNLHDGMKFCDYSSKAMIYRGLFELILKGFICKTDKLFMFYVNPKYAFRGDRCSTYTEYILKDMDPRQYRKAISQDAEPREMYNDFE